MGAVIMTSVIYVVSVKIILITKFVFPPFQDMCRPFSQLLQYMDLVKPFRPLLQFVLVVCVSANL